MFQPSGEQSDLKTCKHPNDQGEVEVTFTENRWEMSKEMGGNLTIIEGFSWGLTYVQVRW